MIIVRDSLLLLLVIQMLLWLSIRLLIQAVLLWLLYHISLHGLLMSSLLGTNCVLIMLIVDVLGLLLLLLMLMILVLLSHQVFGQFRGVVR